MAMDGESSRGRVERAVALFQQGFSCSEAILAAFGPSHGLDERTALKLGCAFGGGVASTGATCGAVSGALMVIGLAHGRVEAGDAAAKGRTYALTSSFWGEFRARHGTIVCNELLGIDIADPVQKRRAAETGLFRERCPALIRTAAELLDRIV